MKSTSLVDKQGTSQTVVVHTNSDALREAWTRTWIEETKKVVVGSLICRLALDMIDKEVR
jgi:hypothetical protein